MLLNTVELPYQGPLPAPDPLAHITLIHGWAAENAIWQDWAQTWLCSFCQVTLVELPGFGETPALPNQATTDLIDAWLNQLWQALPPRSTVLGWSLGGLLAQRLALKALKPNTDKHITGLICMASTPCFEQTQGWQHGVSPQLMQDFMQALARESARVVKQFWSLQLQGSAHARPLIKQLKEHLGQRHLPTFQGLQQGLVLLRALDHRQLLPQLTLPTLWLFGEKDPLIPLSVCEQVQQAQPHAQTQVIPECGHMPFFSHPESTAKAIQTFLLK